MMMELYADAQRLTDQKLQAFQSDIRHVRNRSTRLAQRHKVFLQKQQELACKHGGTDVLPSDIIELNVGGTKLRVLREILTLVQGSRLEVMFSGRWENKLLRDEEGCCVFMDVDPRYFEKIVEYLYSIRKALRDLKEDTDIEKKKSSKAPVPELPKFDNAHEQKIFDFYVDFFHLRENKVCDLLSFSKEKSANVKEEGNMAYEDLVNAFKNEEQELKKAEERLDEMEEGLGREQDFISFFTIIDDYEEADDSTFPNAGDGNSISDDDITFVTMNTCSSCDSHSGSTPVRSNINTGDACEILNIWVSGKVIPVKRSTICQCEGSQLTNDFNDPEWVDEHSIRSEDGTVLIMMDYPVAAINMIINYLRLKAIMAARGSSEDEVPCINTNNAQDFVALKETISKLFENKENFFFVNWKNADSKILASETEKDRIESWLAETNKTSGPQLLYRASRDGWSPNDFHSRCDNEGATITVVKTNEGYVFGGYNDQPWGADNHGYIKSSNEAFMFSLKCHAGILPTKMKLKSGMNDKAAFCCSDYGPTFGGGHDLCIGKGKDLKSGYTYYNGYYELPPCVSKTFLTGKSGSDDPFSVAELEVFKV